MASSARATRPSSRWSSSTASRCPDKYTASRQGLERTPRVLPTVTGFAASALDLGHASEALAALEPLNPISTPTTAAAVPQTGGYGWYFPTALAKYLLVQFEDELKVGEQLQAVDPTLPIGIRIGVRALAALGRERELLEVIEGPSVAGMNKVQREQTIVAFADLAFEKLRGYAPFEQLVAVR